MRSRPSVSYTHLDVYKRQRDIIVTGLRENGRIGAGYFSADTDPVSYTHLDGYKRQGQYGHVKIRLEPNESGKGYEFINAIVGGAVPKEYIPAVDQGIQGAMHAGVLAGYPVVDVKVTLYDGSYHEVDSSEMAFKIAGSMAFKEAMQLSLIHIC